MGRKRQDVTDAELAVLQVIWQQGACTIRQLTDVLYLDGTASDYATVKKLLARLDAKGFVTRDRAHTAHRFDAAISQDDLIGRRLQAMADNMCGGSRTPLLMHLLRTEILSNTQRKELRNYLDELTQQPTTPGDSDASSARNRRQ